MKDTKKTINDVMASIIMVLILSFTSSQLYAQGDGSGGQTSLREQSLVVRSGDDANTTVISTAPIRPQPNPNVNINGIGIYVYDGMYDPDGLEPYKIFKAAGLSTFLIAKKRGVITTFFRKKIKVNRTIGEVKKLDVLLLPGGGDLNIALASWKTYSY